MEIQISKSRKVNKIDRKKIAYRNKFLNGQSCLKKW